MALNDTLSTDSLTEEQQYTEIFAQKYESLLGRKATDEELRSLSTEDKETIENDYHAQEVIQNQRIQEQEYAAEIDNDPRNIFRDMSPEDFGNDFVSETSTSNEQSYRKMKGLMHDYAKLSSAEQAVVDSVNRRKAIAADPELITPEEARSLAGEYGVELKYDKSVARGEVMFAIGKNLYKKEMEYQIADFSSGATFSAGQNLSIMGSAVSGGVGLAEVAVTAAVGFFLPEMAVHTLAKVGQAGKLSADIAKGIDMAYKTKRAAQIATKHSNTMKLLSSVKNVEKANEVGSALEMFSRAGKGLTLATARREKLAKALSEASKATQITHDLAALSLRVPGSAEALSLGSKVGLAVLDAEVSSIPAMVLSGTNSMRNQDEVYTLKDCMTESLFAGLIGTAIPLGGAALGKAFNLGSNAFKGMQAHLADVRNKHAFTKAMEGVSDEAVEEGVKKASKDLQDIAEGFRKPDPTVVEGANHFHQTNMSDREIIMNMQYVMKAASESTVPRLSMLPNSSALLSHVPADIVSAMRRGYGRLSDEIKKLIQVSDIDTVSRLKKVALEGGETGFLGRKEIRGFSSDKLKRVLVDLYNSNMHSNKAAYARVFDYIQGQKTLANDIRELVSRNTALIEYNVKNKGKRKAKLLVEQEDFLESLMDIVGQLDMGDDYGRLVSAKYNQDFAKAMESGDPELLDMMKLFNDKLEDIKQYASGYGKFKTLKEGEIVFNPDRKKLASLADEIDQAADDIAELLDSDNILVKKYGSAENLMNAINNESLYDDTDMNTLFGIRRVSYEEFAEKQKDISTQELFVEMARQDVAKFSTNEALQNEIITIMEKIDKSRFKKSASHSTDTYFSKARQRIVNIDKFLSEGFEELPAKLEEAFSGKEAQEFLMMALKKGLSLKDKQRLRGSSSKFRELLDKHVFEPLGEIGVVISDKEASEFIDRLIGAIDSGKATSLLSPEKLVEKGMKESDLARNAEIVVTKQENLKELMEPLTLEVKRLALNRQLNDLRSTAITMDLMRQMVENPYVPGEVITKLFTFSAYNLENANLNIEYSIRNARAYTRDIENELLRKSPGTTQGEKMLDGGVSLVDYMYAPENRRSILTAMAYIDKYGSADAAKKAGVPFNANDAVIAQVIRDRQATILNRMQELGSMKTSIGSRLNSSRIAIADACIPITEVLDVDDMFAKSIGNSLLNENEVAKLTSIYNRFSGADENHKAASLFALKTFDLDRMFNPRGTKKFSFNEARDAFLSGELASWRESDPLAYTKAVTALDEIADAIVGRPCAGSKEAMTGWLNKYVYKVTAPQDSRNYLHGKFVENMEDVILFKDVDSEIKALDYLGYDSIRTQLEHDFETAQRAYAILKTTGSEPLQLVDDLISFWDNYVPSHSEIFDTAEKRYFATLSKTAKKSIMANAEMAAGVDTVPAKTIHRVIKAFSDILSAPLLVNAGLRSLTDYSFQSQWMITNGLAESKDMFGWAKGVNAATKLLQDKELRRVLGYNQFIKQDGLLRMRTNTETDSLGEIVGKGHTVDKLEQAAKKWSNLMINDLGRVDQFTAVQRSAAAMTIMRGIASQAKKSFADLPNDEMRNLLKRHGLSDRDWDFVRKHCTIEFQDYLNKFDVDGSKIDRDYELFIPDNMFDVDDKVFLAEMEARQIDTTNPRMLEKFKEELYTKASILINSSADEMTTLPTYRTQNVMTLGFNRNTAPGLAMNIIFKYRSFGLACTQIHFGRRMAQAIDTTDSENVRLILHDAFCLFTDPSRIGQVSRSVGGFVVATSFAQFLMNEVIETLKGQHQGWKNENGDINWSKIVDPLIDSTGAFEPILDSVVGNMLKGDLTASGIEMQIAPSLSNLRRDFIRTAVKPWVGKDSADEKAKKFAAATVQTTMKNLGISNWFLTSMLYQNLVGSWLDEQEKGAKAYRRYVKDRRRKGYSVDEWYSRYKFNPTVGIQ